MKRFLLLGMLALMSIAVSCNNDDESNLKSENTKNFILKSKEDAPPAVIVVREGDVDLVIDLENDKITTKWTICAGSFFSGGGVWGYRMTDGIKFIQVTMSYHVPFQKDPWNSVGLGSWAGGAWVWWQTEWVGSC